MLAVVRAAVVTLAVVVAVAACTPKPPILMVEVPGVPGARVQTVPLGAQATGEGCLAPCTTPVDAKGSSVVVTAPGYYPARFDVNGQQMAGAVSAQGKAEQARIQVPLEPCPRETTPPPTE